MCAANDWNELDPVILPTNLRQVGRAIKGQAIQATVHIRKQCKFVALIAVPQSLDQPEPSPRDTAK
jgi:hypothetical protein